MLLRSRQFLAAASLLLLVVVVALSTATRRPCFQVRSGQWHTSAAGHMNTAEGHEAGIPTATAVQYAPEIIPPQSLLTPSSNIPREEISFPGPTIVDQIRNFRSPPFLG